MTNNRKSFLAAGVVFAAAWLFVLAAFALAQTAAGQETAQEPIVYVCPMHADVSSKLPGQCPKCAMKLVAAKSATEGGDFYMCPMHPDVMSNQAVACPKCNMKLVKSEPPETGEYVVRIKTNPAPPKAGEKVKLQFTVIHPLTGKQVKDFNILHDMPFHLFVVSQDLEVFQHIHPDKQPDGSFIIETDLPKAGYYKIFCDFFPAGGIPQVTHHAMVTAAYKGDLISSLSKLAPDKPIDNKLVKTVEGTRFELKFDPEEPLVGKPVELRYHLVDEKTGEPVKDLKPYLGAWGHTLILSEDATDYLHSHPTEMIPDDVDRSKLESKPDVVFDTFFPHPGNYRIWSQFQRGDKIITVPFTIFVPRMR
jgi:hypothetical protein